ncbi:hypothetical protein [Kitasatospora sp. NPDC059160]|uniref:hypothetical protein n=1 Tax=Kitasatospora sp. NPDC059160 TaxID=3346748 RepID=UPI003677C30A
MLRWLSGSGSCKNGACPTLWRTEDGDYVAQGHVITDPVRLAQLNLPPGESAVLMPADVLERYFHAQG